MSNLSELMCGISLPSLDVYSSFADFLEKINSYHEFLDCKLKPRPLKSKTARLSAHRGRTPLRFAASLPASFSLYIP